jgi:hypothetical protein
MTMLTHIAAFLSRGVMGATAYQRWKGIRHIESDTSFMRSRGFTLAMLALLVVSVISLVVVRVLRKVSERKTAEIEFVDDVAREGLTPAETENVSVPVGSEEGAK